VPEFASEDHERTWVIGQVTAAIDATVASAGVAAPIVIGKSLASLSAPVVADRRLAAIWLTPVLTDEPTVSALQAAKGPCMLVGGTADQLWTAGLPGC
jgi:ribulose kinase